MDDAVTSCNAMTGAERVARHRARQVAAIPQDFFDQYVATAAKPTRSGLLAAFERAAANRSPRDLQEIPANQGFSGDGGNRTHVRNRVKGGVYEYVRRSGSHPPLASPAGLRKGQPDQRSPRAAQAGVPGALACLLTQPIPVAGSGGQGSVPSLC